MDESRPRVPARVRITLTCGCVVRVKDAVMNRRQTFPCPSNRGHGYQLRWVSWEDRESGRSGVNPDNPT